MGPGHVRDEVETDSRRVRNGAGEAVATAKEKSAPWEVLEQQRSLVERIVGHWQQGEGQTYNPIRAKAFERVRVAATIEDLVQTLTQSSGRRPLVVGTGAAVKENAISYEACRKRIAQESGNLVLLFGTGWGLVDEVMTNCDLLLPGVNAVSGRDGYNHLSVRAAVAIILDRLVGNRVHDAP